MLHGEHGSSGAGRGVDLEIDVLNVVLDGTAGEHKPFGDLRSWTSHVRLVAAPPIGVRSGPLGGCAELPGEDRRPQSRRSRRRGRAAQPWPRPPAGRRHAPEPMPAGMGAPRSAVGRYRHWPGRGPAWTAAPMWHLCGSRCHRSVRGAGPQGWPVARGDGCARSIRSL